MVIKCALLQLSKSVYVSSRIALVYERWQNVNITNAATRCKLETMHSMWNGADLCPLPPIGHKVWIPLLSEGIFLMSLVKTWWKKGHCWRSCKLCGWPLEDKSCRIWWNLTSQWARIPYLWVMAGAYIIHGPQLSLHSIARSICLVQTKRNVCSRTIFCAFLPLTAHVSFSNSAPNDIDSPKW